MKKEVKKESPEQDFYRDTPARYLGYANEVGEAFRSFIGHKAVLATYGIATLYVLADTQDKTMKAYKVNEKLPNRNNKVMYAAGDTFAWQMLASVIIPGFTINRICALSMCMLRYTKLSCSARRVFTTTMGLSAIPFIIQPIDKLVDEILDNTIRKVAP